MYISFPTPPHHWSVQLLEWLPVTINTDKCLLLHSLHYHYSYTSCQAHPNLASHSICCWLSHRLTKPLCDMAGYSTSTMAVCEWLWCKGLVNHCTFLINIWTWWIKYNEDTEPGHYSMILQTVCTGHHDGMVIRSYDDTVTCQCHHSPGSACQWSCASEWTLCKAKGKWVPKNWCPGMCLLFWISGKQWWAPAYYNQIIQCIHSLVWRHTLTRCMWWLCGSADCWPLA